ncbi:outer membrane protein assembly factor BamB family protein [Streptomyces mayteni]
MAEGEGRIGLVAPVGVLLLALLAAWAVLGGRDDEALEPIADASPEPTAAQAAAVEVWRVPADDASSGPLRLWPHEDVVTVVSEAGVTGYDTVDGAVRWEAAAPPEAGPPCAASAAVDPAGLGAVLYRSADGRCAVLAVVDTRNGSLPWWRAFTGEVDQPTVTVGESAVTVTLDAAGDPAGFHRLARDSGAELPPPDCLSEPGVTAVRHAGSRIVALGPCGLTVHDAETGAVLWTGQARQEPPELLADDPVLLREADETVAYAETGEELWRLPFVPATVTMAGETLLAGDDDGRLAGHDLLTGERRWREQLPPDTRLFASDRDDGRILTGTEGAEGADAYRLAWLDPTDGTRTPAPPLPRSPALLAYDDHQLYALTSAGIEAFT